jgi:hypothetical protein
MREGMNPLMNYLQEFIATYRGLDLMIGHSRVAYGAEFYVLEPCVRLVAHWE